jgi:hypothetical protein
MTREREEGIAGFSIKTLLWTMLGILLFGIYVGVLMYGENSLTVLNDLEDKKAQLIQEKVVIKTENQKLQKILFELKQLEVKE